MMTDQLIFHNLLKKLFVYANILIVFCLLFNVDLIGKSNELDSLYQVLASNVDEETRARAHSRVCWLTINTNVISSQAHMDSARVIFERNGNEKGIASADYKDAVIQRRQGNYILAHDKLDKYIAYVTKMDDQRGITNGTYQKGVLYSLQGNYNASLDEYYKLMHTYRESNEIKGLGFTLNSIGLVYKNLNKFDDARKSYLEVIDMLEGTDNGHDLANAYSNLGSLYELEGNYDQALHFINKAQEINYAAEDNWAIAIGYSKIGSIYNDKKDVTKAETFFLKALEIQNKHQFKERSTTLRSLGELKLKTKDYKKSEDYLLKALAMKLSLADLCEIHQSLSKLYSATNDVKQAFYHHQIYTEFNDSLRGIENLKDINKLQYQFEATKKDNEIIQQDLVIKDKDNLILQKEARSNRSMFIAGLAILGLAFSFFFYRQKQKTKNKEIERLEVRNELTKLESLIEGEEKERKRLAQDLHDGINGDLAVIKYNLITLQGEDQKQEDGYGAIVGLLDNAIGNVRSISHDLAPPSLENYSLVDAITDYCLKLSSGSEMEVNFQNYGQAIPLPKEREIAIFRIVQELLINTAKHAHAKDVLVQIFYHEHNLNISVEDNGVGYNAEVMSNGLGLRNIRSRAQFLGAELSVDSSAKGTSTTLNIAHKLK